MIPVMKIMDGLSDSQGIIHWFVATLLVMLTTLLLAWVGANSTAAGMVFLVLVVWSSTQGAGVGSHSFLCGMLPGGGPGGGARPPADPAS